MTTSTTRPIGVTILAILAALGALVSIVKALEAFGIMPYVTNDYVGVSPLLGIANLVIVALWLYVAYALWTLKPIGWIVAVIFTLANAAFQVLMLLTGASLSFVLLPLLVNAVVLLYCLTPGIRKAFGR